MKKVLSVALASAMVLGMGANAFAISYSTGSNDKADWPENFKFDGELFVTNKDGDIVEEASTELNDSESVNFEPGDVIWMPLYADNQKEYDAEYNKGEADVDAVTAVRLENVDITVTEAADSWKAYKDGKVWKNSRDEVMKDFDETNKVFTKLEGEKSTAGKQLYTYTEVKVSYDVKDLPSAYEGRKIKKDSEKYYIGTTRYKSLKAFQEAIVENGDAEAYVTVDLVKVEGEDESVGKPVVDNEVAYGHYTGNIDKNWSINLIEASTGVAELIEKAELYRATATDYASYSEYTDEIMPKAVYLKVTLKKEWKTTSSETMKYYVYVAKNNGSTSDKTNEVWVSGTYENTDYEYVNFDWTNNANEAKLWKVRKGENGTAVFDFADKAFFTVKMYSEESMYLDLSTAYDKTVAGEMDVEADSFYKFDNDNANFSRTGELVIVSDDDSLVPYSIEDGELVKVDAEYVKDYAIAHTNTKVNGFVFSTKQLGNYVLATEEIAEEVEEPADEEKPAEENKPAVEAKPETKPNPETGAEDFVGLAVSLAVVSVAAAGALALKK